MARKISGGKYIKARKKKLAEKVGQVRIVVFGKVKKRKIRGRGGTIKEVMLSADMATVLDTKTKKSKFCKILAVKEIPSNRLLKNVLMKGVVIETEAGRARITNRPSQEGCVNAILI